MIKLNVRTDSRTQMTDITTQVAQAVADDGIQDGAVLIYCPHTTGAVTVNEGADPDVVRDITSFMQRLVPASSDFRHAEGNSDAHIKSSLFGCEQLVIVEDGRLMLGTWQHIFFCEFDGPRTRTLWIKFLASSK
ncbi:MAG: secondary thiamine-phosphate synthase enzyme YjbQ [Desulfovibrio sp.]|uniref:secondary thiamine-phosphate synthase enzyme YjbQ n=1 Tax=Desulfovibrio sp. 7SRBS1 TaxID=3378064 RepID=UPI003B401F52